MADGVSIGTLPITDLSVQLRVLRLRYADLKNFMPLIETLYFDRWLCSEKYSRTSFGGLSQLKN